MNKWTGLLILLLVTSVTLNAYLLVGSSKQPSTQASDKQQSQSLQPTPLSDETANNLPNHNDGQQFQHSNNKINNESNWPEQDSSHRVELLRDAEQLFLAKNWGELGVLLQNYLKQSPQDMEFLLIEARLKIETTLLSNAIAHYYDLLRIPMTPLQQSEVEQQIETLSQNTIEQLKRNYSWDVLAMFVEPLLQLEPSSRLYILALARAYAELYQEGLMENVLASLDFNDPDASAIRNIIIAQQSEPVIEQIDDVPYTEEVVNIGQPIPLKQYGDQYVVDATLSGNSVALMIDTGASVTAISRQYFKGLSNRRKAKSLGRFTIGTAGGSIMASMYQFKELTINHVTVKDLPVVVLPIQGISNADGLLGMNFLREFDFKIDQRQSVMFLKQHSDSQ